MMTDSGYGANQFNGLFQSAKTDIGQKQLEQLPVVRISSSPDVDPDDIYRPWGVAIEPINIREYGRVAVSGVVPVKVRTVDAGHRFIRPRRTPNNLESQFDTCESGDAEIIAKETPTSQGGFHWALVRLGVSRPTVIAKFTGVWGYGQSRTVTDASDSSVTYSALNLAQQVSGSGVHYCAITWGGVQRTWVGGNAGQWYMVSANLMESGGFDSTKSQFLAHTSNSFLWKSVPSVSVVTDVIVDSLGKVTSVTKKTLSELLGM